MNYNELARLELPGVGNMVFLHCPVNQLLHVVIVRRYPGAEAPDCVPLLCLCPVLNELCGRLVSVHTGSNGRRNGQRGHQFSPIDLHSSIPLAWFIALFVFIGKFQLCFYFILIFKSLFNGHDAQIRDGVESGFSLIVEVDGVEFPGLPFIHLFGGQCFKALQVGNRNPVGQSLLPFFVVPKDKFCSFFHFFHFHVALPFFYLLLQLFMILPLL
nr:MAG TPA: hypothetical protein [Caudoviricetes sp.]